MTKKVLVISSRDLLSIRNKTMIDALIAAGYEIEYDTSTKICGNEFDYVFVDELTSHKAIEELTELSQKLGMYEEDGK